MVKIPLRTVLPGAVLSLALVGGAAPIALADPPGYLYQDFTQLSAVPAARGHKPANDNTDTDAATAHMQSPAAPTAADPRDVAPFGGSGSLN
jgi:hypothetical protein